MVLPDFEIIKNKVFLKLILFLSLKIKFSSISLTNKIFFLFYIAKIDIASVPRIEPPMPITTQQSNLLNLFKSLILKLK